MDSPRGSMGKVATGWRSSMAESGRYFLQRLAATIPVIFLVTVIVFLVMHIVPGDPTSAMVGSENMDPAVRARLMEQFGLDRPLPVQYLSWVREAAEGNLGVSFRTGEPVAGLILKRLAVTAHLALVSLIIGTAIAVPLGLVAATRPNSWLDVLLTLASSIGIAVPSFFVAVLLIYSFSIRMEVFPPSGFVFFWDDPVSSMSRLALPVVALSLFLVGSLTRQTRSAALEVMRQDYVRTAKAKGLSRRVVIVRHVLRNSMLPVVTVLGLECARVLSGAIILETMFAIPGLGRLAIDSINTDDSPTLQAVVLTMALIVVVMNMLVDTAYTIIDPRIGRK